jgi:hypothetical protein
VRLSMLLLAALLAVDASAHSVLPLELDQLVAGAEQVVHVRCIASEAVADATVGVATVTTFVVFERAKGTVGATLSVRQAGGELGGLAVRYPVPTFSIGEEYVLFMPASSKLGLASPLGLAQGAFQVVPGATGKEVGNGRDFAELLPHADPATLPPRAAARLKAAPQDRTRMNLSDFLTIVRAKAGTQ